MLLEGRQDEATGDVYLRWTVGDPGASLYTVRRDAGAGPVVVGFTPAGRLEFTDPAGTLLAGTTYTYTVESDAPDASNPLELTIGGELSAGPVVFLPPGIRYTTIDVVKRRLGIPVTNTDRDDELTSAIIASETAIDAELGRSFPDPGPNPDIPGIPEAVRQAATQVAVRVFKEADRAGQSAGADEWFGTIDIAGAAYQAIASNPVLVGLRWSFGVA